jgi:dienelactone hydrolase
MLSPLWTLLIAVSPCADPAAERTARAEAMLAALTAGEYEKAEKHFDDNLRKVMPADKLEKTWKAVVGQVGGFGKKTGTRAEKAGKYDVVYLTCKFDKATLDLKVVFDSDKRITGFFLSPAKEKHDFAPPPYARADTYREKAVVVGDAWQLPGTLTLPRGGGPFPCVVLVHGSGPHDADETLGPNKPFRDLAWGLASLGVAVLRYEKRTHAHGPRYAALKGATMKDEVIDDALAAVALVRKHGAIDAKRVFVAGHSLGGYLAPKIAAIDEKIAGVVILAGNTRPLEDLILEQFTYLFSLDDPKSEKHTDALEGIRKKVARVKAADLAEAPASELPLGVPASYWVWMRAYDPAATVAKLRRPVLVLQGERDYQVTTADLAGWKKALAGREDAKFVSYPRLNHLFMDGKGKSKPGEYAKAGHVAREVVEEIGDWVKGR